MQEGEQLIVKILDGREKTIIEKAFDSSKN
jgi:hypothetical protein